MNMSSTDAAVIGAGPIGIEMAVALKKAGINYIHFDAGQIGQTITWFPRMMRFFSSPERIAIAGVPIPRVDESKCTREEFLAYLRSVVIQFDLDIHTYEKVVSIEREKNGLFLLHTEKSGEERSYTAQKVILATGDTHYPHYLNIPGEDFPHVSHYFDEPHKYFRQKVVIVGGKNSAVEAAIRCHHCGADVAICSRGTEFDQKSVKFWLLPEINGLISRGEIRIYRETEPTAIGHNSITFSHINTGEHFDIPADFVLLMVGYRADMSLFKNAGVKLSGPNEIPVINEDTMETNLPGIFVAGTASAGSQQSYTVFLENCHIHVERIIAALTGSAPPGGVRTYEQPES